MTHQKIATEPDWLATMPMCGRGVKPTDTLSEDTEQVDCQPCLMTLRKAPEAPPE